MGRMAWGEECVDTECLPRVRADASSTPLSFAPYIPRASLHGSHMNGHVVLSRVHRQVSVLQAIFRQAFPKWWTTVDARETLQQMDDTIERIFDPNAYLSHISSLESSTKAIRISARDQLGVKYRSRRAKYFATSALVSSALPQASLVAQHRHMTGSDTLPAVASKLPPQAKQKLYHAALSRTRLKPDRRTTVATSPDEMNDSPHSAIKSMLVRPNRVPQRQRTDMPAQEEVGVGHRHRG